MLHMKILIITLVLLLAALATSACQLAVAPVSPGFCLSAFEAGVRQGPDAGLSLKGFLFMDVASSGNANGVLKTDDGKEMKVTGQVNGHAVNLTFVAGENTYIFGTGSSVQEIYKCNGAWGGPLAGPKPGDIGDWLGTFQVDPTGELTALKIKPGQITTNFTCTDQACVCRGVNDCVDLSNTHLCKGDLLEITFSDGSKGAGCTR